MALENGIVMASLLEKHGWHEWICHSNFSFKYGASHPHELVHTAAQHQYKGLGITDFDGVYGLARSWRALKDLRRYQKDQSLQLFFGAEIHHQKDHHQPIILQDTLVLIPQSALGYFNLCRLISYSHREGKKEAHIPLEFLLTANVRDLIAIQPMRGLIKCRGQQNAWMEKCRLLRDVFSSSNFFIALSRHYNPAEDSMIRPAFETSQHLGINCLLSQDAFFHEPQQKDLSDLLHAIRLNQTLSTSTGHTFVNGERCLHSLAAIEAKFHAFPNYESCLLSSKKLAESIYFDLSELRYHYPNEMLPPGESSMSFLQKITWEQARLRYQGKIPERVESTLQHELKLIEDLEFADYFLTVWDIVRWARSQDILCQGRGSAANSAVCYVLEITAIDPAHFDLLFERFISAERGDPPDIDVDFEHERREEVIQYIYQRYGREKSAMVANVITFRSRGAIRAVGKALGVPEIILGHASDILKVREFRRGGGKKIFEELSHLLDEQDLQKLQNIPLQHWANMAERISGFPSHLGIHSGGFILSDRPLDALTPQEPATMEGRSVIQWCKEDIESLGFFKIDVLALGMLTALRKCLSLIEQHCGEKLSLASIPADDPQTYDMICRADTVGTFQIESRAQMSMLPRLKPRCFYDLVIEVAIIRPGPIQGGMIHPFLRRREGLEKISFPDARLEPILRRTLGVPIFQEQVMRVAIAVGGFSPGDADELRRNIGSFSMKGDVSRWIGRLAEGMKKNGIPDQFIEGLIGQFKGFSSYGFPESHAASFALLAYASCYLKRHYPEMFFVSLLNSQPMGFYSPHVLLQTAKHLGINVLPVCVQNSEWDFTIQKTSHAFAIRMGLKSVRSLSEKAARELCRLRSQHSLIWKNLEHFLQSIPLSRVDLTALAAANALEVFGIPRRAAIWIAEAAPFCDFLEDEEPTLLFPDETSGEKIHADFRALQTSLGPHPTLLLKQDTWLYDCSVLQITTAQQIPTLKSGQLITVFGMIIVRQAPPSAKGMVFATIEDETGLINLVLTPQVYAIGQRIFNRQVFLCVRGKLQRQGDAFSIKVDRFFEPRLPQADIVKWDTEPQVSTLPTPPTDTPSQVSAQRELVASRNYF